MNLTKLFAAGLCLTAMTASATVFKADSFETGFSSGWDGTPAGARVDGDASLNGYTAARPMTGVTSNKVLKLDTEGGVWTNAVTGGGFPNAGDKVYSDMLVKFVPSEELPAIGIDVKLAIAVLAGTPNKLAFSVVDQDMLNTNVWIVTQGAIDTNVWYRLTIEMGNLGGVPYANIKTNGALVNDLGPYVLEAADKTLNSIGFQGTGYIDEVVVRSDDPIMTAILLTLNFAAGIDSVYVGLTQKTTGQTVTSGDTLVITASQWKQIASLTGPSTITWVNGGLGSSAATVTVANASATTVDIAAQTVTNTTATSGSGTSFDGAPQNKVAAWALANGVTSLTSGIYNNYLFNIDDAATVPTLSITSISVSGSTVTITVVATGINFTTINGTLKLVSYATLGGTPHPHSITFSGTTTATITYDIGSDSFVKAAVE